MTTDSSVQVNLADLFRMEAARKEDEAEAADRARREREALVLARRRAEEAEARAAEAERRLEAEAARRAQEREAEARIERLRAELDAVRTEREAIRLRAIEASAPRPSPRRGWLAPSAATLSLVAAAIAIFVAWPRQTVVVSPVHEPAVTATVEPVEPVVETRVAEVLEVEEAPETPSVETEVPADIAAPARPRRPRRPQVRHPRDDLSSQLDFGDEDGQILSDRFLQENR